MNRRFGAVIGRNIVLNAAGTQDIQDTAEQLAGITSGAADVRLCWRKVFLDIFPEIIVDFPESQVPE